MTKNDGLRLTGDQRDASDYKIITSDRVRAQTATKAADAMEQVLDLIRTQNEMNALLRGRVEALEGMVKDLTAMVRTLNREMRGCANERKEGTR